MENEKELVKFDLEKLKGKKVAVNCKTKEQFQNFVNWVNSLGVDPDDENNWGKFKEDSCLMLSPEYIWRYSNIRGFKGEGYEVISYEESLLKESKNDIKNNTKEESNEITKLQKKITNLQHSLSKKDEKIKNQALEISSLLSQKQHLQQQLDSEVSVKEKYSKSLIIIEYLENKLDNHSIGTRLKEYMIKPNIEGIL